MARLDDGESSYETSACRYPFQGRGNLLSEYEIACSHLFRSLYAFKEVCNNFYEDLVEEDMKGKSQYLGFTHVKMRDILSIDEVRRDIPKMTILYDSREEVLIVKFMVGVTHEICAGMLVRNFEVLVDARTGDIYSVIGLGSARFGGISRMKEADNAFKLRSRLLATDWPSIAFEVGVSERLTQLQQDARFWLECSGGQTRIVIIASVDKRARTIVIQRWQGTPQLQPVVAPRLQPIRNMNVPNPYSRHSIPSLVQTLILEEGQTYTGASLIIPATLLFDILSPVQGAPLGPNDFEITNQMLNRLNDVYWRVAA